MTQKVSIVCLQGRLHGATRSHHHPSPRQSRRANPTADDMHRKTNWLMCNLHAILFVIIVVMALLVEKGIL
jgi:hypothetical protein